MRSTHLSYTSPRFFNSLFVAVLAASAVTGFILPVSASAPMPKANPVTLTGKSKLDPMCPLQCINSCWGTEPCTSLCITIQCVFIQQRHK
jgi:hypothetical protein